MTLRFLNIAAYQFAELDELPTHRARLQAAVRETSLKGTVLISPEGINLFIAGHREEVDGFLAIVRQIPGCHDLTVKESWSDQQPFRRMLIKIKKEIIAFGVDGIDPQRHTSARIEPHELKKWLDEQRDILLLDVRNDYEVRLGTFKGALPIGVDNFRDLPQAMVNLSKYPKDKPVVMFCTGGVRCEKAGPFFEREGFTNVFQLDGGILKYFEDCGLAHYDGDCFVFDHRVAVDGSLQETDAKLCFACRAPLTTADQASVHYVENKSCPHCYLTPAQQQTQLLDQRHAKLKELVDPLPGSAPYENRRFLTVPPKADGQQVLAFLTESFPFAGEAAWRERFAAGLVHLRGNPISVETILAQGDRIENLFPNTVEPDVSGDIRILYEDEHIIAVHKPAPLPMHPCGRFNRNTLISILNQLYRPQKVRLAHRLDANTTGIVVFSRTKHVARFVQPQFQNGEVRKEYLALVHGEPRWDAITCYAAISDQPQYAGARMIVDQDGLTARTEFEVRERLDGKTLLVAKPITGRTNQIRVHAWHLGYPVVGDPMYLPGGQQGSRQTLERDDTMMCLHSHKLELTHPEGSRVTFSAPIPDWAQRQGCPA